MAAKDLFVFQKQRLPDQRPHSFLQAEPDRFPVLTHAPNQGANQDIRIDDDAIQDSMIAYALSVKMAAVRWVVLLFLMVRLTLLLRFAVAAFAQPYDIVIRNG